MLRRRAGRGHTTNVVVTRPVHSFEQSFSLGASSDGGTPVPIPNTEVKPVSADGSTAYAVPE